MELEKIKLEFEDVEINQLISKLNTLHNSQQQNFVELCYTVYKIDCWFEDNPDVLLKDKYKSDYYNKKELFKILGFKKSQVGRLCQCYQKFMTLIPDVGTKIKEPFVLFTPSKLFELLPLSYDKLVEFINNGQLSADMTIKEIREFLKSFDSVEDVSEEKQEESVPLEDENYIVLKNDTARKDFLENYKTWGLWFEEPRLKLKYYRCKIGTRILVAVFGMTEEIYYYDSSRKIRETYKFFYMSENGEMFLDPTCETAILKDMSALSDKRVYLFD